MLYSKKILTRRAPKFFSHYIIGKIVKEFTPWNQYKYGENQKQNYYNL